MPKVAAVRCFLILATVATTLFTGCDSFLSSSGSIATSDSTTTTSTLATPSSVAVVANVKALRSGVFTGVQTINLQGYHTSSDGGGGLLNLSASACEDDGGNHFLDAASHCFVRSNAASSPNSVRWFGAYGDLATSGCQDCSIASGSAILSCSSCPYFSANDVGKEMIVPGAGNASGSIALDTTISAVIDSQSVQLSSVAKSTTGPGTVSWGHDDTSALQSAFDGFSGSLYVPSGNYLHHGLNFTSGLSYRKLYGDGLSSLLVGANVTNPGKINADATTVAVDLSANSYSEVDDIGFSTGVTGAPDTAAEINVLMARTGGSGLAFAIAHSFTNDHFFTHGNGTYNVVLYGYEQTDFVDPDIQSYGSSTLGSLYLSGNNTPGFVAPYLNFVASITSMTEVHISGGNCVIAWSQGPGVVFDEGQGDDVYNISISDCYANISGPNSAFISDTATSSSPLLRGIVLDSTYSEPGTCTTCQMVNVVGTSVNWNVNDVQWYAESGVSVSTYNFQNGLLDSSVMVDSTGTTNGSPEIAASSCAGSVFQIGQQNPVSFASCHDFVSESSTAGTVYGSGPKITLGSGVTQAVSSGAVLATLTVADGTEGNICVFSLNGSAGTTTVMSSSVPSLCGTSNAATTGVNAFWNGSNYVIEQSSGSSHVLSYTLNLDF